MTQGFETLEEIEKAIADVRAEEQMLADKLAADTAALAQAFRDRAHAIRQLAEVRARDAVADGVIDEADRLDRDVATILSARQASIDDLARRYGERLERHRAAIGRSKAQVARIATLETKLDAAAEVAREHLKSDPEYRDRVAKRDELASQIEKATAKVATARKDRLEKGKPYEDDILFMYLWRRDYRGRAYAPHPVIRYLDDKVADLVGYNAARANYVMLKDIPDRLEGHVAGLLAAQAELASEVERREAEAISRFADESLVTDLIGERDLLTVIDAELSSVEAELDEIANQQNEYAEGRDTRFRSAVETLGRFLERSRYVDLLAAARSTPGDEDDLIVERIGALDRSLVDLEASISKRKRELERVSGRRQELIKVAGDLRRKSYHQPGSVFDVSDDDWARAMKMVIQGGLTVAEWWLRAQARQGWRGRSGDPFRRSSGLPPFDFGRGGRSGRSGGKDFRTGGGF
ncbi:MAG: hypothetical protein ACFCUN_05940 [Hyphomicrobiaceae bacterium]